MKSIFAKRLADGDGRTGKQHSDLTVVRRLFRQARPYWLHILGMLLLSILAAPLALLYPVPLKIAVDSVLGSDPLPALLRPLVPTGISESTAALLVFAALMVIALEILKQAQQLGSSLLNGYAGEKLVLDFRTRIFRHAQRLSLSYHDREGTSDSLYRIQYDAPAIRYVVADGLVPLVTSSAMVLGMLYVTARLDWQLALVAMVVAPAVAFLTTAWRGRLRSPWRDVKQHENEGLSVVQEVLTSLRVVKAFGQEEREEQRFSHHYQRGVLARLRVLVSEGGLGLLMGLVLAVGTAGILYLGVGHVRARILSLGELLLIMGYLQQLYEPMRVIGQRVASLQGHLTSAERAFTLLDRPPAVEQRPDVVSISRAEGRVEFRDVSFAYDGTNDVLERISFSVRPGTRVGIAGKTGAGKSTLMGLLTRFYDPTEGQIILDGVDIRDYRLEDLREQFAIVLQDSVLFSTTIAENIAYGRPNASPAEVEAAARAANAHEFIENLPKGYDTTVGERGMRLSGGERQRVALARAFLKDSPLLILDEPTSSVDIRTEGLILDAMERLMQGRTTFMIAHRLSTLQGCDFLLLLDNGRIVDFTSDVAAALASVGDLELLGGEIRSTATSEA